MKITDYHHHRETNYEVFNEIKVPILLQVGHYSPSYTSKTQHALNYLNRDSWIISLEKPWIDNEQKSCNIVAQTHQQPFSGHE